MPAAQEGTIDRPAGKRGTYRARWVDHDGVRRAKGGFTHKTRQARDKAGASDESAREYLDRMIAEASSGGPVTNERAATVDDLLDVFLERHGRTIDPATRGKLTAQLKHARTSFGSRDPGSLTMAECEDFRQELPAGSRSDCFRAMRQVFAWGVARGLVVKDPTVGIKNPKRPRAERQDIHPFEDWTEVEAVAAELGQRYRAIPILAVGTGLRPEEWIALHRSDIDRDNRVLHVQRRYSQGAVKPGGKTAGSVRTVPLRQVVLDALDAMPPRIDTPILFPAPRGGYIDLERFRHRTWTPALRSAGIAHRRVYDARHSFASWAIPTLTLAKIMGTSVQQLEDTYHRELRGDADRVRGIFDAADKVAAG